MAGDMLPYFKMFPAETLADERFSGWTMDERGAWFSLLLHSWVNGSIPSEEAALARILHLDATALRPLWRAIADRFVPHPDQPGRLTSRRLEMEREEASARSVSARAAATSRWNKGKEPDATAVRPQCDRISDRNADSYAIQNRAEQSRAEQSRREEKPCDAPKKPARASSPKPSRVAPTQAGTSAFAAARDRLVAVFRDVRDKPYLWQAAKDSEGLKRILATKPPLDEIEERWRAGLKAKGWLATSNVAQLAAKWNDLAAEIDEHEATFRKLIAKAERELAGHGVGNGGNDRAAEESPPHARHVPKNGKDMSAAVGKLLGAGWEAGHIQDSPVVESGPERGGEQAEGSIREPGDDSR